ncbi:MAG: DUF1540 domain-containing protein [Chitinivibrionales bacterium]|nr:DUF1540 domain-containing protein [Chitinivibrionales bacterium]MBD3355796.1 DUF1540 domain-containing protein [Chitinivibrionales bacterium]
MERDMPKVIECEADDCLYNDDGLCCTFGITVGGEEPCCDTYMKGSSKGGIEGVKGGVGACHVSSCAYNERYECTADGIYVSLKGDHPDCATFKGR